MKNIIYGLVYDKFGIRHYVENTILYNVNDKIYYQDGSLVKENLVTGLFEPQNGGKVWYIDGILTDATSQEEFEKLLKLKAFW